MVGLACKLDHKEGAATSATEAAMEVNKILAVITGNRTSETIISILRPMVNKYKNLTHM